MANNIEHIYQVGRYNAINNTGRIKFKVLTALPFQFKGF